MDNNSANQPQITALPCNSSSSGSCTCGLTNHSGAGITGSKGSLPPPPPPPLNLCIVINICHYLTPLAKLIILSQPLENSSGEAERDAFLALQQILTVLDSGKNEPINVFPFFDKFCRYIGTTFSDFEEMDIFLVWDYLVKLITLVIPPLREIFMGRLNLYLDEHAWHSLTTRCIHAQFTHPVQSLEEFIKTTMYQFDKDYYNDLDVFQHSQQSNNSQHSNLSNNSHSSHRTSIESIKNFNSIILGRSPEILAFAIESSHLPSSLRFLDALNKSPSKAKGPNAIRFPSSFNLSSLRERNLKREGKEKDRESLTTALAEDDSDSTWYDLAAVVTLEGSNCDSAQAYYRYVHEEGSHQQWFKGSGATHDLVDSTKAIEKNYYSQSDSRKVHPRLLIYAKRGISTILDHLKDFVTKGGQLRSKGDATFASAETPEHYDEAKQYYEEAIAYDASLRSVLQDKLNSLEQIEKNQKAQSYENQADLSLGKRRFKEACDLYKLAMRSAVVNSPTYNRIREKEDYMMRIISLEIANHLTEKGEECLKSGSYTQSRENFAQALKLNPNYIHLQSIIQGIDKLITQQTSAQKVADANQAMKIGRYKYANQLFQEAVALVPERESALKPVLESLVVLMQGEDALMKQRAGLIALEDKKYPQAIALISEAITLLPPESVTEHAFFLCDRAQVFFEMKEYDTSIVDCRAALELRPELAIAYLRLGSAQFELELFDEALASFEKAMRNDPSLMDQVKTKIRQVNTAKEVQQRKEREAERARAREEEMKRLEEKRAREERIKREKQEKQREEQAEKAERIAMKEEEKRIRIIENRPEPSHGKSDNKSKSKESSKDRAKREKAEKEALKQQEKERLRLEKEKERERLKAEKEQKMREEQLAREEEERRHREFAQEIEKAEAKLKEAEREKELEKEKARLERERLLAEREKARQDRKLQQEANKKNKSLAGTPKAVAPDIVASPTPASAPPVKSVAAIVAGSTPQPKGYTQVSADPDFPSLGSTVNSSHSGTQSSKKTTNIESNVPVNKSTSASTSTKWSALLSTNNTSTGKDSSHTSHSIFSQSDNYRAKDQNNLDYSASVISASEPSDSVLSSGELKALINKTINDIPAISLPQSSVQQPFLYPSPSSFLEDPSNNQKTLSSNTLGRSAGVSPIISGPGGSAGSIVGGGIISGQSGGSLNVPLTTPNALISATSSTGISAFSPGLLALDSIDQAALSRSHSKTLDPLFSNSLSTPAEITFSSLPSLDENPTPFDSLNVATFPRGLTSSSTEENRTSSRLTSLFGKSTETPALAEQTSSSGFDIGNTGILGNSVAIGSKDSVLGYSLDSYSLNYSFDPVNSEHLTANHANPNHSGGGGHQMNDLTALGMSGNVDSSDSVFASLHSMPAVMTSNSIGSVMPEESSRFSRLFSNLSSNIELASGSSNHSNVGLGNDFSTVSMLGADSGNGFSFLNPPAMETTSSLLAAQSTSLGGFWAGSDHSSLPSSFGGYGGLLSSITPVVKKYELSDLGKRLDDEIVKDSQTFPLLPSLSKFFQVQLFHWATDGKEWVEYALFLPTTVMAVLNQQVGGIQALAAVAGCEATIKDAIHNGQRESVVVISTSTVTEGAVRFAVNQLLEMISKRLQQPGIAASNSLQAEPITASPATTSSNSDIRWSKIAAVSLPPATQTALGTTTFPGSSIASTTDFAIADSMVDSLISPSLMTEKDLLSSPSSLSSSGVGHTSAVQSSPLMTKKGVITAAAVVAKGSNAPPALSRVASATASKGSTPVPGTPQSSVTTTSSQLKRFLEIPSELIGLVIGHQGRKIKELATESGSKIQFRTSKTSEKEGKPGILEMTGTAEALDKAVSMVSELVHSVGKEYREVNAQQAKAMNR